MDGALVLIPVGVDVALDRFESLGILGRLGVGARYCVLQEHVITLELFERIVVGQDVVPKPDLNGPGTALSPLPYSRRQLEKLFHR